MTWLQLIAQSSSPTPPAAASFWTATNIATGTLGFLVLIVLLIKIRETIGTIWDKVSSWGIVKAITRFKLNIAMRLHFSRDTYSCVSALVAPFSAAAARGISLPLRKTMNYRVELMRRAPEGCAYASANLHERFFFFKTNLSYERNYWSCPPEWVIRLYVEGQGRGGDAFDAPFILYREEINVDQQARDVINKAFDELQQTVHDTPELATNLCHQLFGIRLKIDGKIQELKLVEEHGTGFDLKFQPNVEETTWDENHFHLHEITGIGIQAWGSSTFPVVIADVTENLEVNFLVDPKQQVVPIDAIDFRSNFFFAGEPYTPSIVKGKDGYTLRSKARSWVFPGSVVFSWEKGSRSHEDTTGIVDIALFDPSIVIEAHLATDQNVFNNSFYPVPKLFLRTSVAERLSRVQQKLIKNKGLRLKVFDAYRPVAVQQKMSELVTDPRFVAQPGESTHNLGCAIDVTLVNSDGAELEMPTPYLAFEEKAEAHYDGPDVSFDAKQNRTTLQKAMQSEGFVLRDRNWWHFDDPDAADYRPPDDCPYLEKPSE